MLVLAKNISWDKKEGDLSFVYKTKIPFLLSQQILEIGELQLIRLSSDTVL